MSDKLPYPSSMIVERIPAQNGTEESFLCCPYNKHHYFMKAKLFSHLEKCRLNYKAAWKHDPPFLSCKYNPNHRVLAPEISYHEHSCPDIKAAFVDYLFTTQYDEIYKIIEPYLENNVTRQRKVKLCDEKQETKTNQAAAVSEPKMELKPLKFPMRSTYPYVETEDFEVETLAHRLLLHMKEGKPMLLYPEEDKLKNLISEMEFLSLNQENDPLFHSRRRRRRMREVYAKQAGPKDFSKLGEDDDEEDWLKNANSPHFNWMENQKDHTNRKFLMQYPVGLTRAERKEFIKENGIRLRTEFGILPSEWREILEGTQVPDTDTDPD